MFLLTLSNRHRRAMVSHRDAGFGDNLLAAANAWRYAQRTNRALAIVWAPSRYVRDQRENAFGRFFAVPSTVEGVPVVVPGRVDRVSWTLMHRGYYLRPQDPIALLLRAPWTARAEAARLKAGYSQRVDRAIASLEDAGARLIFARGCYGPHEDLRPFFDALQPARALREKIDAFARRHFVNRKVLGVHVRYYNPRSMPSDSAHVPYWRDQAAALAACVNRIKEAQARLNAPDHVVFLSTDSHVAYDLITKAVANVVTYDKALGADNSNELHVRRPVETADASVVEMFLLAKSDLLVRYPPGSWFSHYASLYAPAADREPEATAAAPPVRRAE